MTIAHVPIFANGVLQLHSTVLTKIEYVSMASGEAWNADENNETTKPERHWRGLLG
jgi:hypothetical protein